MENFKRPNKSSIIRIIISKFNDKGIKEFKVLYNKQGGVDTFTCQTELMDNEIIFKEKSVNPRKREYSDSFPPPSISSDGKSVDIAKIVNGKEARRYRVTISLTPENKKQVELKVIDLLENNTKKRKAESSTKRLLLDEGLMERYRQIANCELKDIDSQKIYKIKRFLDYRSNMLIYFQFINDFLTKGTDYEEIWKFISKDTEIIDKDLVEVITTNILDNYITQEMTDNNNRAEKTNKKNEEKGFGTKIHNFEFLDKEKFKKDIEKILYLFAELRHKLMHYNYQFFENLFNGKTLDLKIKGLDAELVEILNLSLFDELNKVPNLREENKTNYLEDDTEIRVLGKSKKAKSIYNVYTLICNRKNGFNKFVNSMFVTDGIEDVEFKRFVTDDFKSRIDFLKISTDTGKIGDKAIEFKTLKIMKNELKEKNEIMNLIGEPYVWDIHQSKPYKKLYNERKTKIAEQSRLISVGQNDTNKKRITDLNNELLEIKKKMEEITKLNSKMRLEYKMQIAFGFLYENYSEKDWNIKYRSKDKKIKGRYERMIKTNNFINPDRDSDTFFEKSNIELIQKFKNNKITYLLAGKSYFKCDLPVGLDLSKFENLLNNSEGFLYNNSENNLSKFYILMYLLIPVELRGDFLGFAKNHYYDIKNIDFVDISEKEEKINKTNDKFFHNLRLFEKNSKKFEIIKYRMVAFKDLEEKLPDIYKKFGIDPSTIEFVENSGNKNTKLFDKNILLPLMKYYQYIFKLLNDIEIHALFRYGSKIAPKFNSNMKLSLSEIIKEIKGFVIEDGEEKKKGKGDLNFSELMVINQLIIPASDFYKEKFTIYKETVSKESGRVLTNKTAKEEINSFKALYNLRNKIAHLNYKELFLDLLFDDDNNLNKELEEILMAVKKMNLNDINILGITFINDFYMKKEQFLFNQKQVSIENIDTPQEQEKLNKEKEFLKIHNIEYSDKPSVDLILKRYKDLERLTNEELLNKNLLKDVGNLRIVYFTKELKKNRPILVKNEPLIEELSDSKIVELVDNIKGKLHKDVSDLLGIYKKYVVKDIKQKLVALFTKGENRYLTLDLYDKTQYNTDLETLGKEAVDEKNKNGEYKKTERLTFIDNSSKNWYEKDFMPIFKMQEDLPKNCKNCNYENSTFIYTSPYEMKNPEKLKKYVKTYKRDILNGVIKTDYKELNEDKQKEEYLGLYNQKIKALY